MNTKERAIYYFYAVLVVLAVFWALVVGLRLHDTNECEYWVSHYEQLTKVQQSQCNYLNIRK